jgi:hypothetical protein
MNEFIEAKKKELIKRSIVGGECLDHSSYIPIGTALKALTDIYNQGIKDCEKVCGENITFYEMARDNWRKDSDEYMIYINKIAVINTLKQQLSKLKEQ